MPYKALLQRAALTPQHSLKTLVENRTVYTLDSCELNVFETYEPSERVPLSFNDLVVTSMLRGKKIMHLYDKPGFDYVPGETVIVPRSIEMKIDFPEAGMDNPTQCIALAIDHNVINRTLAYLNEKYPKAGDNNPWQLQYDHFYFDNNEELAGTLNKLIKDCTGTCITKDAIANLTLQELIIRIIQSQSALRYQHEPAAAYTSAISPAIHYIKNNIKENISLKVLSDKACLSTTTFYRAFKRELGMSPNAYIQTERIKYAKTLLQNQRYNVSEVSYAAGFDDANYFSRLFKKYEGVTPGQYQIMNGNRMVNH